MEKRFLDYFRGISLLGLTELRALWGIAKIRRVKKGDILVREGELFKSAIHVVSGLFRAYCITSEGEDRTIYFSDRSSNIGVPCCLYEDKPSNLYIEALEDSLVVLLDVDKFETIALKHPRLLRFLNRQLKQAVIQSSGKVLSLITLSPQERYLALQSENPSLLKRVQQKHIASYLGVTPVSLSRIKRRISERENAHSATSA